ncbi:MAG: hypothetical protein ACOCZ7_01125 [Armatimonadota bacterium]
MTEHVRVGVTVTPPREIYASHAFAALAAAEGVDAFACDYVGTQELPKEGGACPTYHLRAVRQ